MTWSNGKHAYYGKDNGRGKRQRSKIMKGMNINSRKLRAAFRLIEKEKQKSNERSTGVLQAAERKILGAAEECGMGA